MLTSATTRALRRAAALRVSAGPSTTTPASNATLGRRFASHGEHYNEPSGYLFGEKPTPPGQKRVKEDWENVWYYGFIGSMLFAGVMIYYKPDTSVQSWALKEAKERMEARGEKYRYEPESTPATSS
ncbi:Ndufb11, NADH dehydrogenase 1 beta subcomplex subunit [Ephemerocybe angulata]|uniref:NADH dehydrogenase [ubiquinone] 1 beta subcomplex subunit 11, mitochondrial n=1 Tax=Ephemerocybe angulata TaxID=980116 RepID=A0A8H6II17_9AGAR|nr:Ndufb11, NADH dehydrogenase 1 beta subcomplex subunit [Tulosesus angulatus]